MVREHADHSRFTIAERNCENLDITYYNLYIFMEKGFFSDNNIKINGYIICPASLYVGPLLLDLFIKWLATNWRNGLFVLLPNMLTGLT